MKNGTSFSWLTVEQKLNAPRKHRYLETMCRECMEKGLRRLDSIATWGGLCRSCRSKELAKKPHMQEVMRRNGLLHTPHPSSVKMENRRRGSTHPRWQGGITPEHSVIRQSPAMKAWRKAVFVRDNYACVICGVRGGNKHADHIKPFALFPELRFDVDNGRTLCIPCHRKHGACVMHGKIVREANWVGT